MTECDVCHAKSQLRLCARCQSDLRDTLTQLAHRTATNHATGEQRPAPGWLELLEDARLGRTRLGESARRASEYSRPALARLTDNKLDSFGGSPRELLDNIHYMLTRWIIAINTTDETLSKSELP